MKYSLLSILVSSAVLLSCNNDSKQTPAASDTIKENETMAHNTPGTFGYDVDFLRQKDSGLIVLKSADSAGQIDGRHQLRSRSVGALVCRLKIPSFCLLLLPSRELPVFG